MIGVGSRWRLSRIGFAILLMLVPSLSRAAELEPFRSDGCSAFPDGTLRQQQLWLRCCRAHDLAYWQGGTYQQRLAADQGLQRCVAEVGEPAVALLMLAGVRVGGTPFLPTPFRWGYGWPYPRHYGELNAGERAQVEKALAHQTITQP